MVKRKIVKIDENLCNGCGQCVPNCAEGALQIINGKAKLVSEVFCDGLGACLGKCPQGAITIEERDAAQFDEEAVHEHLEALREQRSRCPSPEARILLNAEPVLDVAQGTALAHWPVQLRLVPVKAPFFEGADLLVTADCVPFAYPALHGKLLSGRSVVVGCPKFDDAKAYADKLGEILRLNDVKSITMVHMEVPCCYGLGWIVNRALEASGKKIPVRQMIATIKGELKETDG